MERLVRVSQHCPMSRADPFVSPSGEPTFEKPISVIASRVDFFIRASVCL
jgi:hypothetical protein